MPPPQGIDTEGSRLAVPGGWIWYRVVGGGSGTPLILVHGGPGLSSYYLESMEALGDERTVVRYDQLGAGKSDFVTDTSLFNIPHFVGDLDSLRSHLGLEKVALYGHSWGSILAFEYYRAHPEHVAALILASEVLDMPAFMRHIEQLQATVPDSASFAHRYSSHTPNVADEDSLFKSYNKAINDYMTRRALLRYDATPLLKDVRVPVLFIVGDSDFVGPSIVKRHAGLTPGARFVVIPHSGHMTQWDNPAANNKAVRSFLREVDASRSGHARAYVTSKGLPRELSPGKFTLETEGIMGSMNVRRVILGGFVAGVILMIIDLLASTFVSAPYVATHPGAFSAAFPGPRGQHAFIGPWVKDLLHGFALMWCYAAIRPRFGPGPRTAVYAAVWAWSFIVSVAVIFYSFQYTSLGFTCIATAIYLVQFVIAAYVGGMLYREEADTTA